MFQLQPFEKSDYAVLLEWIDTPALLMQFAGTGFQFPLTAAQLDQSLLDPDRHAYKALVEGKMIGFAEIYIGTSCAYLGRIIIGDKTNRGKGVGLLIVQELLTIAFTQLNQELVGLNVFDWNLPAIRCYEKAGFTLDPGKLLERYYENERWIAIHMILPKKKWLQLQTIDHSPSTMDVNS